jgi:hypothetical protein
MSDNLPIAAPDSLPPAGRDAAGRFAPGNRISPGTKPSHLKLRLKSCLDERDVEAAARVLREIRDDPAGRPRDRLEAIRVQLEYVERRLTPAEVISEVMELRERLEALQQRKELGFVEQG